jgi:hypothetical protein
MRYGTSLLMRPTVVLSVDPASNSASGIGADSIKNALAPAKPEPGAGAGKETT